MTEDASMGTTKEFYDRLDNDPQFASEIATKVQARMDAGEQDPKAMLIQIAGEYGYAVSIEELEEISEEASKELSEEELGKVSGGTAIVVFLITVIGTAVATAGVSATVASLLAQD